MPRIRIDALINALPTTVQLLTSGGDERILPDPVSGLNKYGCGLVPDCDLHSFGSSTASTISQAEFSAISQLRDQLSQEEEALDKRCAMEMARIRREFLALTGLSDLAIELQFAASGTDAHFLAARYAAGDEPLKVLMVQQEETGSGVQAALASTELNFMMLRLADGSPRPVVEIDAEVTAQVAKAVAQGQRILLIMVDQSKTGLIAPSVACVMRLHQRYPDQLQVLVDACQFRIASATLRAYLQLGFMVALTGSKFFAGPSFSAALLLPKRLRMPVDEAVSNVGLMLRWEAAMFELRRFFALPEGKIIQYLEDFSGAVQYRLLSDPCFEPVAVLALDRQSLQAAQSWDHLQSIFPFVLFHRYGAGRVPLNRAQTLQIYHLLQVSHGENPAMLRYQFGQPVACGKRESVPVSALRLCISARQISDAAEQQGIQAVIAVAMAALDKAAWLVEHFIND